jgi:hypothetical protein
MSPPAFHPGLPLARDNHIVSHVHRMRLTTRQVISIMFDMSEDAVSQVTCRLVEEELLSRHPLHGSYNYYTLGGAIIRRFQLSKRLAQPLGVQTLPKELGVLAFCCLDTVGRKRLYLHELRKVYPWFPHSFSHHPFYFDYDDAGVRRLGTIRVEPFGSPSYVIKKHLMDIDRYCAFRASPVDSATGQRRETYPFRELIDRNELVLSTVTATEELAEALTHQRLEHSGYPPARFFAYPDLVHVIGYKDLPYGS